MRRVWMLVVVGVTLWPATGQPAAAASFALTEREQQEAIRLGRKSVVQEQIGGEWTSDNGSGETLTVVTPFHRLPFAGGQAPLQKEAPQPRGNPAGLQE